MIVLENSSPIKKLLSDFDIITAVKFLKDEKQINLEKMMLLGSAAAIMSGINTTANDLDFAVDKDYFEEMKLRFPESLTFSDYTQNGIIGFESRKIEIIRFNIRDYLFEFWSNYIENPVAEKVRGCLHEYFLVASLGTQLQQHLLMGRPKNERLIQPLIKRIKNEEEAYIRLQKYIRSY